MKMVCSPLRATHFLTHRPALSGGLARSRRQSSRVFLMVSCVLPPCPPGTREHLGKGFLIGRGTESENTHSWVPGVSASGSWVRVAGGKPTQ